MSDKVKVTLSGPYDGKKPGDTVSVDEQTAIQLVKGGYGERVTDEKPSKA